MNIRTLKQFALAGSALAILAGCSSAPEKAAEPVAQPVKADDGAAARAAAEKKAADEAAARAASEKTAADEAEAKRRAAEALKPPPPAAPKALTLKGKGMFDFNKSVLRPDAKTALDTEIVARKAEVASVKSVSVSGHADRIGSHEYNMKLSEKRAEVVKAYLVGQGIPPNSVEANGYGKTQPATGAGVTKCEDSLGRAKLIDCLQPHRRVEVELKGDAK